MIVCDVTNPLSLQRFDLRSLISPCRASEWKDFVDINVRRLENDEPVPCILVANKVDTPEQGREVSDSELATMLKEQQFDRLFLVSAKTGHRVREAFE